MTVPTPPAAPTPGPSTPGPPTSPPTSGPPKVVLALAAAGLVVVAVVGTLLITRDSSAPATPSAAGSSVAVASGTSGTAAGGTTGGTDAMDGMDMSGMDSMLSMDGDGIVVQYRAPDGGPVIVTTMADGEINFDPPAVVSSAPAAAPVADGALRTVQFVLFGKDGAADVTITTPDGTTTLTGVVPSSDPNSAPADRTMQVAAGQKVSMTATRTAGSGSTNCAIIVDGQNVDMSLVTGEGAVARCEATL